jgi:hypothetical protein
VVGFQGGFLFFSSLAWPVTNDGPPRGARALDSGWRLLRLAGILQLGRHEEKRLGAKTGDAIR